MSGSANDILSILFLTLVPVIFILIHIFLSLKVKLIWSLIMPFLWAILGIWMIATIYYLGEGLSSELIIFFTWGEVIFIGITVLIRYLKKRKKMKMQGSAKKQ
jgi:hypothetical protein